MAEFNFYGTPEDFWVQLGKLIAANRFTFMVDMSSKERTPFEFKILTEEIKQVVMAHPTIFLWSDEYSKFPLYFTQSSSGLFRIYPLKGGPLLELHLPHAFQHETRTRLTAGNLMHQATYTNADTGNNYPAPENLRLAYKDAKVLLQSSLVKRYARVSIFRNGLSRNEIVTCWIGLNALDLLATGQAEIQITGQWMEGKDLQKNPARRGSSRSTQKRNERA